MGRTNYPPTNSTFCTFWARGGCPVQVVSPMTIHGRNGTLPSDSSPVTAMPAVFPSPTWPMDEH